MTKERSNVLLVYDEMIPSVRLCGHLQMQNLANRGIVDYRAKREVELSNQDLNWADLVIIGRMDSWMSDKLVRVMKKAGKYIAYILDDDLLEVPEELSSGMHYRNPDVCSRISGMIENSDAIISPSPMIHKKYSDAHHHCVLIEEPVVEPVEFPSHDLRDYVKIGFAGSVDRKGDIERILEPVLRELKEKYGRRVRFEFFGAIPEFAQALDARSIPYCDSYGAYRKKLNELEWDIGLAPMPDTPFHACKHYNKYVEYAAAGILGVFSDVMPYTRLKEKTDSAVFCSNDAESWLETLRELIDNSSKREQLRFKAWSYSNQEMSIRKSADDFALQLPLGQAFSGTRIWVIPKAYVVWSNIIRVFRVMKSYGWKAPAIVVQKMYRRIKRRLNERSTP